MLRELDFEFEEDEAQWLRWFNELQRLYEAQGPGFVVPLASSNDLLLSNWYEGDAVIAYLRGTGWGPGVAIERWPYVCVHSSACLHLRLCMRLHHPCLGQRACAEALAL